MASTQPHYTEITVPGCVEYRAREIKCIHCVRQFGLTFVCERQRVTEIWCPDQHTSPVPALVNAATLFEIVSAAPDSVATR